jgi:hypothetical protein
MDIKCFFSIVLCFFAFACSHTEHRDLNAKANVLAQSATESQRLQHNKALALKHFNDQAFDNIVVSDAQLFYLAPEQIAEFDAFYHHPRYAHLASQNRFSEFLTTRLANFTYDGQTFTATEAFKTMSGNCLSLAVLTTALAKHAGLDIRYQRVDAPPIYEKHGNILLLSTHVRTRVYGPQPDKREGVMFVFRPYVTIDYFPSDGDVRGETLSSDSFLAMYHRNMAAQALIEQKYSTSYAHVKKALLYESDHSETFNLLAVLYNRIEHKNTALATQIYNIKDGSALALYKDLIDHNNTSLNAIENYLALLAEKGNTSLVAQYADKLEGVNDRNPYQWLRTATEHYEKGELRLAQKYAERAIEFGPYLDAPQFLLAKVHYKLRRFGASRDALLAAKALSRSTDGEKRYIAKLNALSL